MFSCAIKSQWHDLSSLLSRCRISFIILSMSKRIPSVNYRKFRKIVRYAGLFFLILCCIVSLVSSYKIFGVSIADEILQRRTSLIVQIPVCNASLLQRRRSFSALVRYQLKVHPEGCKNGLSGCIVCLYQFCSEWGTALISAGNNSTAIPLYTGA